MNNDYLTIFHFLFFLVCSFFVFLSRFVYMLMCLCVWGFLVRFIISNIYLYFSNTLPAYFNSSLLSLSQTKNFSKNT